MKKLRTLISVPVALLLLASMPVSAAPGLWVPTMPTHPLGRRSVSLFPDGTGYVYRAQAAEYSPLFKTTDFGATFLPMEPPSAPGATVFLGFATPSLGWAASSYGFSRTTDGGATWAQMPGPVLAQGDLTGFESIAFAAQGRTIFVGGNVMHGGYSDPCADPNVTRPAAVFTSHDWGATWSVTELDRSGSILAISVLDEETAVVRLAATTWIEDAAGSCTWGGSGTIGSHILMTEDGAESFETVLACAPRICSAQAIPSRDRIVVGHGDGTYAVSDDRGETFTYTFLPSLSGVDPQPYARWVEEIAFADAEVGYLSTSGRGVYRTEDGGRNWVREPSTQDLDGAGIGSLAVADREHALVAGRNFVSLRVAT